MKMKIFVFSFIFLLIGSVGFAQKNDAPKSIIRQNTSITKYHDKDELELMQKGELLKLYIERIEVLVNTLPYIAFATKSGVTMSTLGIPDNKDNRKTLDEQFEATDDFLENTVEFEKKILPYSDTSKLIAGVLFFEETLKALHTYSQFHQ